MWSKSSDSQQVKPHWVKKMMLKKTWMSFFFFLALHSGACYAEKCHFCSSRKKDDLHILILYIYVISTSIFMNYCPLTKLQKRKKNRELNQHLTDMSTKPKTLWAKSYCTAAVLQPGVPSIMDWYWIIANLMIYVQSQHHRRKWRALHIARAVQISMMYGCLSCQTEVTSHKTNPVHDFSITLTQTVYIENFLYCILVSVHRYCWKSKFEKHHLTLCWCWGFCCALYCIWSYCMSGMERYVCLKKQKSTV